MIDLGGATTDVHAAIAPKPAPVGIRTAGLPALPLRRTVEGDLGMRWSAPGVLEADGGLAGGRGPRRRADARSKCGTPVSGASESRITCRRAPGEDRIDRALATACVTHALRRHCGTLGTVYVPGQGTDFVQRGADLRDVPLVIGTGGVLGRHAAGEAGVAGPRWSAGPRARSRRGRPRSLSTGAM